MDIVGFIKDHLIIVITISTLLLIFIYSIYAVTLNKLNKSMYGKTTWMAWIPIFNIYLLGKLTIHFIIGIILVILFVLSIGLTLNIKGVEKYYSILTRDIQEPIAIIFSGIMIILFIYARIKSKKTISKYGIQNEVVDCNNLNRPFIEKKSIDDNKIDNSSKTSDDFYKVESDIDTNKKISLNSISNHQEDNKENPNN